METVEVVIKIPKRTYDRVSKRGIIAFGDDAYYIGHAIENGTVLPKGHGELIDKEQLFNIPLGSEYTLKDATKYGNLCAEQQHFSYSTLMMYELADIIEDAPIIIEADKEDNNG